MQDLVAEEVIDRELASYGSDALDRIRAATPGLAREVERCASEFGAALALVVQAEVDGDDLTAQLARTRLLQITQEVFVMAGMDPPTAKRPGRGKR